MSNPFITLFKKPLNSISDEITTKFRTPFFTTYIIVWVIKNNLFIYDLFFNETITTKRDLLKSQFNISEYNFYGELLLTLLISLGVLIAFYFFLNISRTITIFSEERVKLNILNLLKSKTISSIDDVNFWKKKSNDLNEKNKNLEDEVNIIRLNNKEIDRKIINLEKENNQIKYSADKYLSSHIREFENQFLNTVDLSSEDLMVRIKKFKDSLEGDFQAYKTDIKPKGFIKG